jgi:hypothetical protein
MRKRVRGLFAKPPSPPEPAPVEASAFDEVVSDAAARQLRDLRLLRRILPSEARVVFGLQPIAWGVRRELSPEEHELFELLDVLQTMRWRRLRRLLETRWTSFAVLLEEGCRGLGVPFVDLAGGDYEGWCFVDRVHMTDRGYEAAAGVLEEVLGDVAG